MSRQTAAAILAALLPASAVAEGWELRASLDEASAMACTDSGTCFGLRCQASDGWRRTWVAVLEPTGAAAPDPILGLRLDGTRYALTTLAAVPAEGPGTYRAPVAAGETAFLEALMSGEALSLDAGRDFAPAELPLVVSRWAISETLSLCDAGGPERFVATEEE